MTRHELHLSHRMGVPDPVYDDNDRAVQIDAEPIIAWGLNPRGTVMPITPSDLDVQRSTFAVRQTGTDKVYAPGWGWYDTDARWLAELQTVYRGTKAPHTVMGGLGGAMVFPASKHPKVAFL
jgi:hypothetical protein